METVKKVIAILLNIIGIVLHHKKTNCDCNDKKQ